MALKAAIDFNGVAIAEAYARLRSLQGGKDEGRWDGTVVLYASELKCYPQGRVLHLQRPAAEQPAPSEEDPTPDVVMEAYDEPARPSGDVLNVFTVAVPYADADPRPLLYAAARAYLEKTFGATGIADA